MRIDQSTKPSSTPYLFMRGSPGPSRLYGVYFWSHVELSPRFALLVHHRLHHSEHSCSDFFLKMASISSMSGDKGNRFLFFSIGEFHVVARVFSSQRSTSLFCPVVYLDTIYQYCTVCDRNCVPPLCNTEFSVYTAKSPKFESRDHYITENR